MVSKEKITNANSFPKDWPIKKLADIGSTYGGLTNKSKEDFAEGNSKFITYKNIYNNTFINTNELESVRIYKDEKQNKVKYGDVFFTGSSETPDEVGISSVLLEEVDDVYLNSFCFGFRFNDLKKTIPEFYGYYFRGPVFRNEVYPLAQGSTRFNLSKSEMVKLKVPVPPVKEQRKIAAILSSVDEAIEKTEAIIEQTEKVKKGLMQQLLTKGIGHTKFKKTEIGEIPEEWEVMNIGRVCKEIYRYPTYYNIDYVEKGVPEIRGEMLKPNGEIDTNPENIRYISEETASRFPRTKLEKHDIVMSVRGTIGKVGIVPSELAGANITANLIRLSPKEHIIDKIYFKYFLLSDKFKKSLDDISTATTIKTLKAPDLKNIPIPVPDLIEQRKIVSIMKTIDKKLLNETTTLDKLNSIKKFLMQVLLTGKVRVKVDNEVMSQ